MQTETATVVARIKTESKEAIEPRIDFFSCRASLG